MSKVTKVYAHQAAWKGERYEAEQIDHDASVPRTLYTEVPCGQRRRDKGTNRKQSDKDFDDDIGQSTQRDIDDYKSRGGGDHSGGGGSGSGGGGGPGRGGRGDDDDDDTGDRSKAKQRVQVQEETEIENERQHRPRRTRELRSSALKLSDYLWPEPDREPLYTFQSWQSAGQSAGRRSPDSSIKHTYPGFSFLIVAKDFNWRQPERYGHVPVYGFYDDHRSPDLCLQTEVGDLLLKRQQVDREWSAAYSFRTEEIGMVPNNCIREDHGRRRDIDFYKAVKHSRNPSADLVDICEWLAPKLSMTVCMKLISRGFIRQPTIDKLRIGKHMKRIQGETQFEKSRPSPNFIDSCTAVYDWDPDENPGYAACQAIEHGDRLWIRGYPHDGWIMAYNCRTGCLGLVPTNYVRMDEEVEASTGTDTWPSLLHESASTSSSSRASSPSNLQSSENIEHQVCKTEVLTETTEGDNTAGELQNLSDLHI